MPGYLVLCKMRDKRKDVRSVEAENHALSARSRLLSNPNKKGAFDQMVILDRMRANPWVLTLLSLVFTLTLMLSWTTAAHAQSDTPFDVQYTLLGIEDDPVDPGQNQGQSSRTSTVPGQEVRSAIQGLLPSTGGPQLLLVILGSAAVCFSSALFMQHVRNRRR